MPKPNQISLLRKAVKWLLLVMGGIAVVMILLAFTPLPFHAWYRMGMKEAGINRPPDYIVLLGGGGMPSESGLMRSWYTAKAAAWYTRAKVIIALPGNSRDSLSSIRRMKDELILRGIAPDRILLEDSGTNTRAQALLVAGISTKDEGRRTKESTKDESGSRDLPSHSSRVTRHASLLLVTSPEHLPRAVATFRKAGFLKVDGLPAFEQAIESDITFSSKKLGGRKFIPDIGGNITLRYQFWTQMNYEFLVLREWAAMGYYWVMGWV